MVLDNRFVDMVTLSGFRKRKITIAPTIHFPKMHPLPSIGNPTTNNPLLVFPLSLDTTIKMIFPSIGIGN